MIIPGSVSSTAPSSKRCGRSTHNYFGWFEGDPAVIDPLPRRERSARYVAAMGGRDAVVATATRAHADGDFRWAAEILTHVLRMDPDDQPARQLKADALRQLGYQTSNPIWRNNYLMAAKEIDGTLDRTRLLAHAAGAGQSGHRRDDADSPAPARRSPPGWTRRAARGSSTQVCFRCTDTGTSYGLAIRSEVAEVLAGAPADATIEMHTSRADVTRSADWSDLVAACRRGRCGDAQQGNRRRTRHSSGACLIPGENFRHLPCANRRECGEPATGRCTNYRIRLGPRADASRLVPGNVIRIVTHDASVEENDPMPLPLPPDVAKVFQEYRACEFTTLAKDGTPITWPTLPFYDADAGRFVVTTSVAFPQKAFNIRRDPRVSLLFSDPTGSGLVEPPAVLIQGDAEAPDRVDTLIRGYEERLKLVFQRQPSSGIYSGNPLMRRYFDWYYMRLLIVVTPRRIRWWPQGDFTQASREIEL